MDTKEIKEEMARDIFGKPLAKVEEKVGELNAPQPPIEPKPEEPSLIEKIEHVLIEVGKETLEAVLSKKLHIAMGGRQESDIGMSDPYWKMKQDFQEQIHKSKD